VTETYYYTLLALFVFAVYVMSVDENISAWVWLQFSWFWVNVRRRWFILTMAPRLHYDVWRMKQEVKRIRKEHGLPND
jgi:hypothetical protein